MTKTKQADAAKTDPKGTGAAEGEAVHSGSQAPGQGQSADELARAHAEAVNQAVAAARAEGAAALEEQARAHAMALARAVDDERAQAAAALEMQARIQADALAQVVGAAQAGATARAGDADRSGMAEYEVISRLDHDGETYVAGDFVPLTAAQAEPLLDHTVKQRAPAPTWQ